MWQVPILATTPEDDGTSTVTIGTVEFGQAQVMVAPGAINHPDIGALYAHAANMRENAYTAVRRSRRDEQRST